MKKIVALGKNILMAITGLLTAAVYAGNVAQGGMGIKICAIITGIVVAILSVIFFFDEIRMRKGEEKVNKKSAVSVK